VTRATYRMYAIAGPADLTDALAEYRARHGGDPRAILLGAVPDGLTAVDGVPVVVEADVPLPAGVAYMEVGR